MQTRSQTKNLTNNNSTKKTTYKSSSEDEVYIDFDEASAAWKANKKSIGNG